MTVSGFVGQQEVGYKIFLRNDLNSYEQVLTHGTMNFTKPSRQASLMNAPRRVDSGLTFGAGDGAGRFVPYPRRNEHSGELIWISGLS